MNVFLHGGRIGDTIYALYIVKKVGGGIFQQCLRHAPHRWDEKTLLSVLKLVRYQPYINDAIYVKVPKIYMMSDTPISALNVGAEPLHWNYSFIDSESQSDPENYPDLCYVNYLHYAHQARRHCVYFKLKWNPDDVWLTAPKTKKLDILFHAPSYRLVRSRERWQRIIEKLSLNFKIVVVSGEHDRGEWSKNFDVTVPPDHLEVADYVNSAHCFLGAASSCYAIAEALKKMRFIELAPDCFNNYPYGKTGRLINEWSDQELIAHVKGYIYEQKDG